MNWGQKSTATGPRPRSHLPWAFRRGRRRGIQRLLDHSLPLRLLLAVLLAGGLMTVVERWEHCHKQKFAQGCLQSEPTAIISVGNIEALSIITAAFLYLLEGTQRRQRENLDAMDVILTTQQAGARLSYARNDAVELLTARGIWLDGLDLSQANLEELQAPHGRWRHMNLKGICLQSARLDDTDLKKSDLTGADLRRASLQHVDLSGANLGGCDLREANLTSADLEAADLRGADLRGADLRGARLIDARFDGALLDGADLEGATINGVPGISDPAPELDGGPEA